MTAIRTAAYAAIISILPLAGNAFAQNAPAEPAGQAQPTGQAQPAGDKQTDGGKQMTVEQHTATWPAACQKAAKEMVAKYGRPTGMTPTRLVWADKEPFEEIILLNEDIQHDFPMPHKDCLEHVVEFKVPTDKVGDLAKFDGSIIVDRTRGTIGARCDSEAHNLLALNLACDIINGKKSVEEARKAYGEMAMSMMKNGTTPDYAAKLTFHPMPNSGDTDMAMMNGKPGEAQPAAAQ